MSTPGGHLDNKTHAGILEHEIIPNSGLNDALSHERPRAIILAGQPGAGKGGLKDAAKLELQFDVVPIDPDELRDAHPDVERLRQRYPYTWAGYTHDDASQWAKELRTAAIDGRKNIIVDTTLGNGDSAVNLIDELRGKGYEVEVRAIVAHHLESEHGVDERFAKKLDVDGYGRYVPEDVRKQVYDTLPSNLDKVHAEIGAPSPKLARGAGQNISR